MDIIEEYLKNISQALSEINRHQVFELINCIQNIKLCNGTIYICGNGGSAANAAHFANDLSTTTLTRTGKRFNAIALTDSASILTAISNDIDYSEVFKYQLIDRISENDLLIGLSGSGKSENIMKAFQYARSKMATTCAIIGFSGGYLKELADIVIHTPVMNMQISEDIQLIINHVVVTHLLRELEKNI